ncbi:hypothetical protein PS676_05056 [Pseudomonas fluorescens]|nr:hypothetical protein PS676_05056 [Pseudomonas fluorescens]
MRKACRDTRGDHGDAAHGEGLQTVQSGDGEGASLGQDGSVRVGAVGEVFLVDGQLAAFYVEAVEGDRVVRSVRNVRTIRGVCNNRRSGPVAAIVRIAGQTFQRHFGNAVEACGGKTDGRIDPPGHFLQQHKTVAAAQCTAGGTRCARACGRRFSGLGRVITGGDGFLQLLDIGQLRLSRRGRLSGVHVRRVISEQLRIHLQTAATPERQFLAILQMHRHRAFGTGDQLIAGIQAIPLDQHTPGAVAPLGEHLTNDLTDDTDERSHVHFLRCQPLSASCCLRRTCSGFKRMASERLPGSGLSIPSRRPGDCLAKHVARGRGVDPR